MSRLTLRRLCVRAPRIRIVSMGRSANIHEPPFPAPTPTAVNSPARMSPTELRASLSLASVFALRLFGMFVVLPVLALWADGRPGWTLTLVGLALGAYGLTQAVLQVPFGWLSDRHGRKPVIHFGLLLLAA